MQKLIKGIPLILHYISISYSIHKAQLCFYHSFLLKNIVFLEFIDKDQIQ